MRLDVTPVKRGPSNALESPSATRILQNVMVRNSGVKKFYIWKLISSTKLFYIEFFQEIITASTERMRETVNPVMDVDFIARVTKSVSPGNGSVIRNRTALGEKMKGNASAFWEFALINRFKFQNKSSFHKNPHRDPSFMI